MTYRWRLTGEPLKAQAEALRRSYTRRYKGFPGYGFFMEQGLGKTATAMAEALDIMENGGADSMTVICPSHLLSVWTDEPKEFGWPHPVYVWPNKPKNIKAEGPCLLVMNYEATLYSGGEFMEKWLTERNTYLAVDESSALKNFSGPTSKRNVLWAREAVHRRALTGTPMSQSVMDLWAQLRFIGELNGVNPYQFRNRYAVMGGYMGKKVTGAKNEAELHELLESCSFRALKKDWTSLKDKRYVTRSIQMVPAQIRTYREMLQDFITGLSDGTIIEASQVITQQLKLQQISRGFIMGEKGLVAELVPPKKNPAMQALMGFREELDSKLLVFTLYTYSTDTIIRTLTEKYGVDTVAWIRGGMSTAEQQEQKDRFNKDPRCRTLVGQYHATYRGHTLLGQPGADRCHTSFFYENSYSLEMRSQIEDRNHRTGQDCEVDYIDLVASEQDKKPIKALQKKQDLVTAIVDAVRSFPLDSL